MNWRGWVDVSILLMLARKVDARWGIKIVAIGNVRNLLEGGLGWEILESHGV